MIVKNESQIIERCLNSAKGIVDCICICDTGSNDNTVEIIEQFLRTHNIPGKVYHHHWKNFGHNRSLSAKAAQEMLQELGFDLRHAYLLLLDADMMLEFPSNFNKDMLVKDCYVLTQRSSNSSWLRTRV